MLKKSTRSIVAGISNGPTISAYHAVRCTRCAATAWGSGALPGGKTAASSISPSSNGGTRVDTATEPSGRYV